VIELRDDVLTPFERELDELGDAPPVRSAHAALHLAMTEDYRDVAHAVDAAGTPEQILAHVDWETTRALRQRVNGLRLGIAEAMDTAQRFEIGWNGAKRLIEITGALDLCVPFIAGASSDHRPRIGSKQDLITAVAEQAAFIREAGGEPILLPMPWLVQASADEDDYVEVYRGIVARCDGPVWIHWLGETFLPSVAGYFPGRSFERVMAIDRAKIRGVKLSLLDAAREIRIRNALAQHGQVVVTGDDLHFAELIAGDDAGFSHALLGILDAIARPASIALRWLAHGRRDRFLEILRPCEDLGRHVFETPTPHYKAGLAFLAWLQGLQPNRDLPNHLERARDASHYRGCAVLASRAGAIENAALANERLSELFG